MADLNGGKGKFTGVDSSVKYADSFKGATKVAEKVKKGGTEKKSDGYVVDAIDIDWGGLKLTTIDNGWSQKTVSSTEQNAGKGDNTQGIHSTAYLLNLISGSFDQIYNQIGGSDNAGLRKKITDLQASIDAMAGVTPDALVKLKDNIDKINNELADPGAAGTMKSILDILDGFNKDTDNVKDYIDKHDKAILGASTDAATAYTVYGVRKYVDTTAKENLIGKKGDKWSAQTTLYGVVEYVDTTAKDRLIGTSTDTTIDTHYGLKHILIGKSSDAATADTIWGAKKHAVQQDIEVKNILRGATGDQWANKQTIWGAKNYADGVKNSLLGESGDQWPTKQTIWGVKDYADRVKTLSYLKAETEASNVLGKPGDLWPTQHTVYGVAKYTETLASSSYAAVEALENRLIGASTDATTANTIWGAKNYAKEYTNQAIGTAESTLLGKSGDLWPTKQTLYGVVKYSDNKNTDLKNTLIGTSTDTTINTHYGLKHILIGKSGDASTADTIWGAKNYAQNQANQARIDARNDAKEYADTTARDNLIGTSTDTTIDTHYGLKHILIGKSTDAPTADTIWGAKNYADTTVKNSLVGATGDQWPTKQTIWGVKNSLIGATGDHSDSNTIWGAKNYAKNQISGTKYNQLTAQVIEENGEGILKLLTVSSYLG